jgi:gliding motility-associated-like protein
MNNLNKIRLIGLIVLFAVTAVYATDPYSKDIVLDYTGYFQPGWTCFLTKQDFTKPAENFTNKETPLPNAQVSIMRDTTAYDPNVGDALKIVPTGSKYSIRLGSDYPGGWTQHLKYKLKVDSINFLLVVKFAVVVRNKIWNYLPSKSDFNFINPNDCATCDERTSKLECSTVYSAAIIGEKINMNPVPWHSYKTYVKWCDWTTVSFILSGNKNKIVDLDFFSGMGIPTNSEYCYVYFIAETHPAFATVKYCPEDKSATLSAPEGFAHYTWFNSKGMVIDSSQNIVVNNPIEGDFYDCLLSPSNGFACKVPVRAVIPKVEKISADFTYQPVDCAHPSNTASFTSLQPVGNRRLVYRWDFGDGATSSERNPTHTFATSGIHQVSLTILSAPMLCPYTVSKVVETFTPLNVGITGNTVYCPGYPTTLKGYGAYKYKWSNGEMADSIREGNDTVVWMVGYSSAGCHSDTIKYKLTRLKDWAFRTSDKSAYCQGDSLVLWGSGAFKYKWSTGATSNSIIVRKPGSYTIIGTSEWECDKSKTFNVVEIPKPKADFNMSANTINAQHNELTCSVPYENGVQYHWDMGDGLTESGASIRHAYTVTNSLLGFNTITLKATNQNGCTFVTSKKIEVTPFAPNVFTPNGDGVNDVFMFGFDLQIMDRNGTILFNGMEGWNGMYGNKKMGNDTYFYVLNYTDKNHQIQTMKGYITLSR